MAVYTVPDVLDCLSITCVICLQTVPLAEVTPGSLYSNGSQAFACTSHLLNRELWINTWALFDIRQKEILVPLFTEAQAN